MTTADLKLSYIDGRPSTIGIVAVNEILRTVGVHTSQIQLTGRKPKVHNNGHLNTSEHDVAPYPKVYDIQAIDEASKHFMLKRFRRLYINTTNKGVSIDEFYRLPDGVVVKLSVPAVEIGAQAWRISYPGKRPHSAFLDAKHGLIVAYAHGPKEFVIRYEDPNAEGAAALGTNPWIDFSGDAPRMLDDIATS